MRDLLIQTAERTGLVDAEKLADFLDLKIATTGFTEQEFIKALGATPVPINLPEMYTAMERGVVDAYFTITIAVFDFGLQDITPYCLDERVELGGVGYVINLDKWNDKRQASKYFQNTLNSMDY